MEAPESASLRSLNKVCAFLCDLWGADKVYRAMAYGSKLAAAGLESVGNQPVAAQHIRSMGDAVGMARYAVRFWGTLDAVAALRQNPHGGRGGDKVLAQLHTLQAASMVVYHPIEHACWMAYVTKNFEVAKLVRARNASGAAEARESKEEETDFYVRMAHMGADALLALHWSIKGGMGFSEGVIGALGLFGAVVGAQFKWRAMGP